MRAALRESSRPEVRRNALVALKASLAGHEHPTHSPLHRRTGRLHDTWIDQFTDVRTQPILDPLLHDDWPARRLAAVYSPPRHLMNETNERAKVAWAGARLLVWPERYVLASFPPAELASAAALVGSRERGFAGLVVERDEVSVTVDEDTWLRSRFAGQTLSSGPCRAITIDMDVDLDVCGFLAPAALRLAAAGISIVPQCAFRKDHLLIHDGDLDTAIAVLEKWMAACRAEASGAR